MSVKSSTFQSILFGCIPSRVIASATRVSGIVVSGIFGSFVLVSGVLSGVLMGPLILGLSFARPALACEALVGGEYVDPLETLPMNLQVESWQVAMRSRDDAVARKELVPAGQTLLDWKELVSWQLTFGTRKWDLVRLKDEFLTTLTYQCPQLQSRQLALDESSITYEWWHEGCFERPAQYNIVRLIVGETGTHNVSYARRGSSVSEAEREQWIAWIQKLAPESDLPKKQSPVDQARVAITARDSGRALELLQPLAKAGDPAAQEELAGLYAAGLSVEQDYAEAKKWFEKAAAQGYAPAQYRLGTLYEGGLGVSKSLEKAKGWFEKAAQSGDAEAQGRLGYLLASEEPPKLEPARQWFSKSAAKGHEHAITWLGRSYEEGWIGEADLGKARATYEQAAYQGEPDAQYRLGLLYREGRGVSKDESSARVWIVRAAMQGNPEARELYDRDYRPESAGIRPNVSPEEQERLVREATQGSAGAGASGGSKQPQATPKAPANMKLPDL